MVKKALLSIGAVATAFTFISCGGGGGGTSISTGDVLEKEGEMRISEFDITPAVLQPGDIITFHYVVNTKENYRVKFIHSLTKDNLDPYEIDESRDYNNQITKFKCGDIEKAKDKLGYIETCTGNEYEFTCSYAKDSFARYITSCRDVDGNLIGGGTIKKINPDNSIYIIMVACTENDGKQTCKEQPLKIYLMD